MTAPQRFFFGIGAQKCGTSWANAYLRSHPQVCVPSKEMHYWDVIRPPHLTGFRDRAVKRAKGTLRFPWVPNKRRLHARIYDDPSHGAYLKRVRAEWTGEPLLGDITPSYALLGADTFAELQDFAPDVRFFYLMRDPVDRLHSAFHHNHRRKTGKLATEDAVMADLQAMIVSGEVSTRSRYDLTLDRLDRAVDPDRLLVLFYEELFRQETVDRLTAHLDLPPHPGNFGQRVNAGPTGKPRPSEDFVSQALAILAPIYRNLRERYGEAIPSKWRM